MRADAECYICCRNKVISLMEQYNIESQKREQTLNEVDQYLQQNSMENSAPELLGDVLGILERITGIQGGYARQKRKYNQLLLSMYSQLERQVKAQKSPLYAALQYALVGNYIDFGAMDDVYVEKLEELLDKRKTFVIDEQEYLHFCGELSNAKSLVYLTDNAGEIVTDRLLIETILHHYPDVKVTVIVRGNEVLNDATLEDVKDVQFDERIAVMTNGVCFPGTPLERVPEKVRTMVGQADLCIAKGQGNFESLCGCGHNIYYLFLCKCQMFVNRFQVSQFAPVVKNEKRLCNFN
ncbi:MAG: ARMT1-like domain-containing protein [Hespellia sp.]|nr:ARMT1-like domain-containing protein [Hespellia sp.]